MRVKINTAYRMRGGGKAFVTGLYTEGMPWAHKGVIDTFPFHAEWTSTGKFMGDEQEHELDLMEEWND